MRERLLDDVAGLVPAFPAPRCVRLAVDGADGVGKSTFARELAAVLSGRGRDVVQVSADDFHHRRAVRHRRGRDSPEGFWLDSYDYKALCPRRARAVRPGGLASVPSRGSRPSHR
ncbi:hypothetical protein [Actinoplanes sp. NBRC 103695]|uniref:hypothetical protein n=1 Tax=Actinoplanes sp. NBRC 103695 TaxID=3032202 RepID=UPI0024A3C1AD|nr:hypothetical protein [Actinoplanes sp. NBRC 103695]GLY95160.1 hypothetical protein Acsp02_24150 [Actinoplanes sp. NBRC 103695]